MSDTTGHPDLTITHGRGSVVISGDRAVEMLAVAECRFVPTYAGYQLAADDLPKLRAIAKSHGWTVAERDPRGGRRDDEATR
jgi:hypothetical protein